MRSMRKPRSIEDSENPSFLAQVGGIGHPSQRFRLHHGWVQCMKLYHLVVTTAAVIGERVANICYPKRHKRPICQISNSRLASLRLQLEITPGSTGLCNYAKKFSLSQIDA
jgi:hypothetical protein